MAIKTREKLIEVARQLFARKGIENTTMNDIANASEKGRRTIYTYFKNKREIYNAVVEKESEQLVTRLREVLATDLKPTEKLMSYIDKRFDIVVETVHHHRGQRHVAHSFHTRSKARRTHTQSCCRKGDGDAPSDNTRRLEDRRI